MTSPCPPRPRLAVVEDDAELREKILLPALRAAGFEATGLASALQFYRTWVGTPFDLVLLDVGLPDDDGVEIARHLRGLSPALGIVMYTGLGHRLDRSRGLEAGADAWLVKPLDMEDVIQVLHSVHRQRAVQSAPPAAGPVAPAWTLERDGWSLRPPTGVAVALSPGERRIMGLLAASPDAPVSREALIADLGKEGTDPFDPHRLEMLVYRLRQKCRDTCGHPLPLRAVRGMGYLFEP